MRILVMMAILIPGMPAVHAQDSVNIIRRYQVEEARQGVALDDSHLYVINNTGIMKLNRETGEVTGEWRDTTSLIHMNGGVILDDTLFCAHSNYPGTPMQSTVEYFDPATLKHLGNHSFGIFQGSLTWVDRHEGFWYAGFAHYTGRGGEPGKDNRWTRVVRFDRHWRFLASWTFPHELLERFEGRSNSGGVMLENGLLLATGHDNFEMYLLELPATGSELIWRATLPVGSYGQSFSVEPIGEDRYYVFGIIKEKNEVVVSELVLK